MSSFPQFEPGILLPTPNISHKWNSKCFCFCLPSSNRKLSRFVHNIASISMYWFPSKANCCQSVSILHTHTRSSTDGLLPAVGRSTANWCALISYFPPGTGSGSELTGSHSSSVQLCLEVRGQLRGVSSLIPSSWVPGSNSGCQAWAAGTLPHWTISPAPV